MKIMARVALPSIAILGALSFGPAALAGGYSQGYVYASPRTLIVPAQPAPFGDRYAFFSPPGPHQLSSPYHTLCGLDIETECSTQTSYGP